MKKIISFVFSVILLAWASSALATPIIEFSGGTVYFVGNSAVSATTFTFTNAFVTVTDPNTPSINGTIVSLSGPFTIGSAALGCGASCYNVSGSGTLKVNDAGLDKLIATVDIVDIYQSGSGGGTNYSATANLSGITATGDLAGYATGGILTTSFNFRSHGPSLATLAPTSYTANTSSGYSGLIEPHSVPEPATLLLMGAGLLGVGVFGRKKIKA